MMNVHVCNIGIRSIHGKELLGHLSFHHEYERSQEYRNFDRIDDEPMEFEWNIFPGFKTLQLSQEVKSLLLRLGETPKNFTGRIVFMSMFNDISCGSKDNEKRIGVQCSIRFSYLRNDLKKWYTISADSPQGEWDRVAELMMIKFGERGHPVFRATSSLSRGTLQSKGGGKLSIHFCADGETIETVFRTIISVNQLSLNGAVAEMYEEYETFHDRTGQPVVGGQSRSSFVPRLIKTEVPLD